MADEDRVRWDERHAARPAPTAGADEPPAAFPDLARWIPTEGGALDLACGSGAGSVWLARRGLEVLGVDVSRVAVDRARARAEQAGLADRCRFEVADLDAGLPAGPAVDVVLCHLFSDRRLDDAVVDRLRPGGVVALAVLSEVGAVPGRFRAVPGELLDRFGHRSDLAVLEAGEA